MYKLKQLVALTFLGLFVAVSSFAASDPANPGILKRVVGASQDTPTRVYVLVRYASRDGGTTTSNSPTLASGSAVIWDTTSDDGVTIRTTTVSADPAFAGITVSAILSPDTVNVTSAADDNGRRNWGYAQVYGPLSGARIVAGGTNANSAKDVFVTSRDEGCITGMEAPTVLPVVAAFGQYQAVANGRGGFFFNAGDGTTATATVYIKNE